MLAHEKKQSNRFEAMAENKIHTLISHELFNFNVGKLM